MKEEIEKYRELLHKSHSNQKQSRKSDLNEEFNFLKSRLETGKSADFDTNPIDLTGMLNKNEDVHANHGTR